MAVHDVQTHLEGEGDDTNPPGSSGSPSAPGGLGAVSAVSQSAHAEKYLVHRLCSVDVSEVFSPPRVGKEAMKFGLEAGDAMDLTTGWGFTKEEDPVKGERYVDEQRPLVLIGSPPCVAFSQLQSLIPDSQRKAKQLAEGDQAHGVHGQAL